MKRGVRVGELRAQWPEVGIERPVRAIEETPSFVRKRGTVVRHVYEQFSLAVDDELING